MSSDIGKCNRIRHIVRLRQMLRRWRAKAAVTARINAAGSLSCRIPADVPAGHVAVCVGTNSKRFVVRATYLNHPVFRKLLVQAEEEYGFSNHGPLAIPCDELIFEEILRSLSSGTTKRCSHLGTRSLDSWLESRPLLHGLVEKSVW